MQKQIKIKKTLFIFIILSVIIRGVLAGILELTNDEVNYWLYAMYPAASHFEHPPMVGFFIQLTTLNLLFDNVFFMRLSSVILGAVNTYIIFLIGKNIKNEITGLYAALLFTGSFYLSIISGVFIHPDTPLVFFWLTSLYFLMKWIFTYPREKFSKNILIAGLTIGLGMTSKYSAAFLWLGVFIYIIFFDKSLLKKKEVYFAVFISFLCFLPVIIWNLQNELQTLSFWEMNVHALRSGIRLDFLGQELSGQILYNNPMNFIIILTSLIFLKKKFIADNNIKRFLLLCSFPVIVFFILISLFGRTLPHWSGPGYIALILIASAYLSDKYALTQKIIPLSIRLALILFLFIVILGFAQINYGLISLSSVKITKQEELGKNDITLDMYGWKQAADKFRFIDEKLVAEGKIKPDTPVFSDKWFNAGHIDYYIAHPMGKQLFAVGTLGEIRKYKWVNEARGGYDNIKEAYYITPSRDYRDPRIDCSKIFSIIVPMDTIRIERNGVIVENMFVFVMKK